MTQALTTQEQRTFLERFTPEEQELLRSQIAKNCTNDEIAYFLAVSDSLGLSPFHGHIYAIKYGGRDPKMVLIVGINGIRSIAARSPRYAGTEPPEFGPMVADRDVEGGQRPEYADCVVYRRSGPAGQYRDPFKYRALWEHHARKEFGRLSQKWVEDPRGMLAKCAEMGALRQAFPASKVWEKLDAVDNQPVVIEGSYTEVPATSDELDTGKPLPPTTPTSAPSGATATPAPHRLDEDLRGYLAICPEHNSPWMNTKYGLVHKTAETKIAQSGPNKGKEINVTCYAKRVLPKYVIVETERLGYSGPDAALMMDDFAPGTKLGGEIAPELCVDFMQWLRKQAADGAQKESPNNSPAGSNSQEIDPDIAALAELEGLD